MLNKLLSRALPSLRQIIFEGVYAPAYYECNPIMPLIIERLYGPNPLTMLRIDSTFALDLKGREHQNPSHPIAIKRLKLYGLHSVGNNDLPLVLASTLVHLMLGEIRVDWFWNSFVTGAASDSADGGLVFSCLKSLHMYFPKPEVGDRRRNVTDFHESRHAKDFASETERESRSYTTSSTFGRPRFPALTTLAIAFFPRSYERFLSLFTASPISWLYLCHAAHNAPSGIDLSQFIHLRSLEVQFIDDVTKRASRHVNKCLSDMFESTGSRLERLDMKLKATDAFKLRITASHAFAHNIRALQLDDHITIDDIVLILPHLPSLERLEIGAHAQRPIESLEELIRVFRAAEAAEQLTPLNTSLKLLRVWPSRYYMSRGDTFPRTLARSPVSFYFNLFVELVCRLPALEIMRVNISPMDWLHSTIQALLDSGIGSEQIENLRRLQIRPVAD
ncbi:hypothetical protein FBU31_002925 [Coemansia sp. 'formosensis']|nr:hypothetical protein FBU31_002925 [Coemansia sp. 'formosensis']